MGSCGNEKRLFVMVGFPIVPLFETNIYEDLRMKSEDFVINSLLPLGVHFSPEAF